MKLKTLAVLAAILPALAIAAPAKPSSGRASQSKPANTSYRRTTQQYRCRQNGLHAAHSGVFV